LKPLLLLDLDDTLLKNNIDDFLPQYLAAFAAEVAGLLDPDRFVKSLLAGTHEMVSNRQPDCTLQEKFESVFLPMAGLTSTADFQPTADRFYAERFPLLKEFTQPIPQAVEFVNGALERGCRMAVATNPLFPRTAILQRLSWAGLPADQVPFELIPSYESFHFAKPDLAYFAELLARIGWPEGPVLMVGDDLERDIRPARSLGLPAYWISQGQALATQEDHSPSAAGSLEQVFPWLDQSPPASLEPEYNSPQGWLAILRATPAALDGICRVLPELLWTKRPAAEEWCFTEILCHLRDVDREVNLPRIQQVLGLDNPFLPGQDTDPWAEARLYRQQNGPQALRHFIEARIQIVQLLESLDPDGWQRPARHAIFGPTRLRELVSITASHDRLHLQQVHRLLDAVFPSAKNPKN
jgi:FMN phosphatase YigB (HAD superfamily)